jgi:benzoylformate decarboxylase
LKNRQYLILKHNLLQMKGRSAESGTFVGMDFAEPELDYVALARSMGVDATTVTRAGDVGDALRAAAATARPHLLELPVAG